MGMLSRAISNWNNSNGTFMSLENFKSASYFSVYVLFAYYFCYRTLPEVKPEFGTAVEFP